MMNLAILAGLVLAPSTPSRPVPAYVLFIGQEEKIPRDRRLETKVFRLEEAGKRRNGITTLRPVLRSRTSFQGTPFYGWPSWVPNPNGRSFADVTVGPEEGKSRVAIWSVDPLRRVMQRDGGDLLSVRWLYAKNALASVDMGGRLPVAYVVDGAAGTRIGKYEGCLGVIDDPAQTGAMRLRTTLPPARVLQLNTLDHDAFIPEIQAGRIWAEETADFRTWKRIEPLQAVRRWIIRDGAYIKTLGYKFHVIKASATGCSSASPSGSRPPKAAPSATPLISYRRPADAAWSTSVTRTSTGSSNTSPQVEPCWSAALPKWTMPSRSNRTNAVLPRKWAPSASTNPAPHASSSRTPSPTGATSSSGSRKPMEPCAERARPSCLGGNYATEVGGQLRRYGVKRRLQIPQKYFRADVVPYALGHYVRMYFQFDPRTKLASLRLKNQLGATEVAFDCFADAVCPVAPNHPKSRIRTKLAIGLDQVLVQDINEITNHVNPPKLVAFKLGYLKTTTKSRIVIPQSAVYISPFNDEMQAASPNGSAWEHRETPETNTKSLGGMFFVAQKN